MQLWFTADPHFGHANIIRYCKRPFATAEEMDATILDNINSRVKPGDRLFILGDFCGQRRSAGVIQSYVDRIRLHPQQMVLVLGNHDDEGASRRVFPHVYDAYRVKHQGQAIELLHYAMRTWNGSHRGAWHLYGHSHGSLADLPTSKSFDVGVDCHKFCPLSFDEVAAIMATKTFVPVDHHKESEFDAPICHSTS